MQDSLGTIEAGKLADIVAVPGDPACGCHRAMEKVDFVMKGGVVYLPQKRKPITHQRTQSTERRAAKTVCESSHRLAVVHARCTVFASLRMTVYSCQFCSSCVTGQPSEQSTFEFLRGRTDGAAVVGDGDFPENCVWGVGVYS